MFIIICKIDHYYWCWPVLLLLNIIIVYKSESQLQSINSKKRKELENARHIFYWVKKAMCIDLTSVGQRNTTLHYAQKAESYKCLSSINKDHFIIYLKCVFGVFNTEFI